MLEQGNISQFFSVDGESLALVKGQLVHKRSFEMPRQVRGSLSRGSKPDKQFLDDRFYQEKPFFPLVWFKVSLRNPYLIGTWVLYYSTAPPRPPLQALHKAEAVPGKGRQKLVPSELLKVSLQGVLGKTHPGSFPQSIWPVLLDADKSTIFLSSPAQVEAITNGTKQLVVSSG